MWFLRAGIRTNNSCQLCAAPLIDEPQTPRVPIRERHWDPFTECE